MRGGILKESWSCNKSVDAQLYVWEPPKIPTYLTYLGRRYCIYLLACPTFDVCELFHSYRGVALRFILFHSFSFFFFLDYMYLGTLPDSRGNCIPYLHSIDIELISNTYRNCI